MPVEKVKDRTSVHATVHLATVLLASALALAQVACEGGGGSFGNNPNPNPPTPVPFRVETVTGLTNLSMPVTMAFAPDGRLFFNELQTGRVRVATTVDQGRTFTLLAQRFATLPVETSGERGLLGLAFDPNFIMNRFVYILYSDVAGVQRVVRFTEANGVGSNQVIIVDNLPSNMNHNGGNIGFGRDGRLYVTIGDSGDPANSQSQTSLSGKILRYNASGTIPPDNPFGAANPAFNLGLRNSFDFTFHPQTGTIYASENGPNCDDEINRVVAGANYGWRPNYPCGDSDPQFVAPIRRFNPVIAPTGITFYTGTLFPQFTNDLFMVDFNTGRIQRFTVNEQAQGQVTFAEVVSNPGFGALFDIVQSPDGLIYFSSATAIHRIVPQ